MTVNEIEWRDVAPDTGIASTRDFFLRHDGREVPGALWLPPDDNPSALILVGHGGSRHKREKGNLLFVAEAVERNGVAVAAIDGPLHGARRDDRLSDPVTIQREFLDLWETPGNGIVEMVADWQASIDALVEVFELKGAPVGYFGLSMGTAYGLPLVASDQRIGAAVLGMWGSNHPNSSVLLDKAVNIKCPVLFMHKSEDNFFSLGGALEIYNALPGCDKRFLMNEGPHAPPVQEQISAALGFFADRLVNESLKSVIINK